MRIRPNNYAFKDAFLGLIRLLAWGESEKSKVMVESCRIIRHFGSAMIRG